MTGGGIRIGREIALRMGLAGATVIVNYNRSRTEAIETTREIESRGGEASALRADVSSSKQVAAMFEKVERRFGRLDILVNNAGVFFPGRWDALSDREWDRVLGVNLKGAFFCAQAAARLMQQRKSGRIINISSLGGLQAWPEHMHYCASKAALIMLTRCLAKALAPHVQVNSVAPGWIMFSGEPARPDGESILRQTPLRRTGRPSEIADTVLFLATGPEFITGQVIAVDGGKSIP